MKVQYVDASGKEIPAPQGFSNDIPAAQIPKVAKSVPKSVARLDTPTAPSASLKEGDTFTYEGKTHTVRQVLPDGTVWTNDGQKVTATEADQSLGLAPGDSYFNGKDKKFAPASKPQAATPKEGDTFVADNKSWTVRQVMPDGTVWANDGKKVKATEADQSLALAPGQDYWDGKDKKFAPGEIPPTAP